MKFRETFQHQCSDFKFYWVLNTFYPILVPTLLYYICLNSVPITQTWREELAKLTEAAGLKKRHPNISKTGVLQPPSSAHQKERPSISRQGSDVVVPPSRNGEIKILIYIYIYFMNVMLQFYACTNVGWDRQCMSVGQPQVFRQYREVFTKVDSLPEAQELHLLQLVLDSC